MNALSLSQIAHEMEPSERLCSGTGEPVAAVLITMSKLRAHGLTALRNGLLSTKNRGKNRINILLFSATSGMCKSGGLMIFLSIGTLQKSPFDIA